MKILIERGADIDALEPVNNSSSSTLFISQFLDDDGERSEEVKDVIYEAIHRKRASP
jgi:hypothetical protein